MKKYLAVAVILLFISVSVIPSTGMLFYDDTTPPVTTHTLDPPEPDGDNGWYVSNVTITFNATDDISGVKATYYRIDHGGWKTYNKQFVEHEGKLLIEYYSIDNANNAEDVKSTELYIDQTKPMVEICLKEIEKDIYVITTALDQVELSGMNRVEYYLFDELQIIIYGSGPEYQWKFNGSNLSKYKTYRVCGFMLNPKIVDQNITFYAIAMLISESSLENSSDNYYFTTVIGYDNAGNWRDDYISIPKPVGFPKLYLFQQVTLPKHFSGHFGNFFVEGWFTNY